MCSNSPWYFRRSEMFLFPPFFFCLLALTIPFRMTEVLKCVLCLSWQVTSVWRNNLQSTVTTLSTANKEREHSSHLVPGLTKRSSQVQARHRVWKNVFYAWKEGLVVLQRTRCEATAALCASGLRSWVFVFAERSVRLNRASRIVSGYPTWWIIIPLLPLHWLLHIYLSPYGKYGPDDKSSFICKQELQVDWRRYCN